MKWIGHTEFGPNYIPIYSKNLEFGDDIDINHWIEQWHLAYRSCLETLKDKKNVNFICYEKLCASKEYWSSILKTLDIKETYDFEFKESQKEIPLDIDNDLSSNASSLYSELSEFR